MFLLTIYSLIQMPELDRSHSPCALRKNDTSHNVFKTVHSPNHAWAGDTWLILQHSLKPSLKWYDYICITRISTVIAFLCSFSFSWTFKGILLCSVHTIDVPQLLVCIPYHELNQWVKSKKMFLICKEFNDRDY